MNSKFLGIVLIIIVLVFGAVYYYTGHGRTTGPAAVTNTNTTNQAAIQPSMPTYHNDQYGFSIEYPSDMTPTTTFSMSYLLPDNWSVYATPTSTGDKIVDFVIPNSNNVTAGELRVGASTDPAEVKTCTTTPSFVQTKMDHETINNTEFALLIVSEGAMNHYSTVKSYRIIRNNTCFVVDTFVYGTNPQVYEPPAVPPFSQDYAFSKLDAMMQTFRFDQ